MGVPSADELLDAAFEQHLAKQPPARPTNYQAYWFGLGVKSMRPYVEKLENLLVNAQAELARVQGGGNGHGA